MRTVKPVNTLVPLRDRISSRLGLLFFATFMATLFVTAAWGLVNAASERAQSAEALSVKAQVIVIDPKIQSDLKKAMAFDAIPTATQVQNPFLDRANLGGTLTASTGGMRTVGGTTQPSASTVRANADATNTRPNVSMSSSGTRISPRFMEAPVYDVKSRYEDWLDRQRRGEFVQPESEVLTVEDLIPVGYASGGDRGAEVMLFSSSLCRTFTFPAGTRFYDGYLNGFDQNEVIFMFQNGLRRKSYSTADTCAPGSDPRATGTAN